MKSLSGYKNGENIIVWCQSTAQLDSITGLSRNYKLETAHLEY